MASNTPPFGPLKTPVVDESRPEVPRDQPPAGPRHDIPDMILRPEEAAAPACGLKDKRSQPRPETSQE